MENKKREKTLVFLKPGFVEDWIIEEASERFEDKGFEIVKEFYLKFDEETARIHYINLASKPFCQDVIDYITSDKVYVMIIEGPEGMVKEVKDMVGETQKPAPGTLRHDITEAMGLKYNVQNNVAHASENTVEAEREIGNIENLMTRTTAKAPRIKG